LSRGCGSRVPDALYACIPTSPYGKPAEYFIVDPAIPFNLPPDHNIRAPFYYPDPSGTYHLLMGVGVTYYPFVSDFIEEAKVMGVSKRLPQNFDYSKLDPQYSNLILIHKRAIPNFSYHIEREDYYNCPRLESGRFFQDAEKYPKDDLIEVLRNGKKWEMARHQCVGDLWALSSALHVEEKHELEDNGDGMMHVETPSTHYLVDPAFTMRGGDRLTWVNDAEYQTGVFFRFPRFHFEYVRSKPKEAGDTVILEGERKVLSATEAEKFNEEYETALEKIQEVYVDKGFGFKVVKE